MLEKFLETDESLYYFILKSTLRMIVLDQLSPNVVARIKTLRPTPSYYTIIADNANMERLFKIVSRKVFLENSWDDLIVFFLFLRHWMVN